MRQAWFIRATIVVLAALTLAGCSARYSTHGWTPTPEMLRQIVPGVDSRATVEDTVGVPTTSGMLNRGNYYYVETTMRAFAWQASEVVDRRIVAISFDEADIVSNIETYGLEDGRVVAISRRVTETVDGNIGFLRQLFGNVGGLSAEELLN